MQKRYTIDELASHWRINQAEIFYMADCGELTFSLEWKGACVANKGKKITDWIYIDEFVNLPRGTAAQFRKANYAALDYDYQEPVSVLDAIRQDGQEVWLHVLSDYDEWPEHGDVAPDGRLLRKKSVRPPVIYPDQIVILADEVSHVEAKHPELTGAVPQRVEPITLQDNPIEDYAIGNNEIALESGMSRATFKKFAELAGIIIEQTEGNNPKNMIKKSDIRRVIQFRNQY